MSEDARFEELFHAIMEYEKEAHKKNQKRIKIGIHCLIWIPLIFLALLFATDSSKVIFLVLWIASLFVIASYLIYVEYSDFKMQERITTISNRELDDVNVLIGQDLDEIERSVIASIKHLEVKKEDAVDSVKEMVVAKLEDRIETGKEALQDVKDKVESKMDRASELEEDGEPLDKVARKAQKKADKAEKKLAKQEQKAEKKAKKAEKKAEKKAKKAEKKAEKKAKMQEQKRGDGDESDS